MSRNALIEAGAKSELFVYELSSCELESSCSQASDFAPVASKEFLDIQATIECAFTPKRVRDMIRTYSQMYRTDKYSTQLNHLVSLANWLSVRLRAKWLWVRVQLQSFIKHKTRNKTFASLEVATQKNSGNLMKLLELYPRGDSFSLEACTFIRKMNVFAGICNQFIKTCNELF